MQNRKLDLDAEQHNVHMKELHRSVQVFHLTLLDIVVVTIQYNTIHKLL